MLLWTPRAGYGSPSLSPGSLSLSPGSPSLSPGFGLGIWESESVSESDGPGYGSHESESVSTGRLPDWALAAHKLWPSWPGGGRSLTGAWVALGTPLPAQQSARPRSESLRAAPRRGEPRPGLHGEGADDSARPAPWTRVVCASLAPAAVAAPGESTAQLPRATPATPGGPTQSARRRG